jgi:hypothetical protein
MAMALRLVHTALRHRPDDQRLVLTEDGDANQVATFCTWESAPTLVVYSS